VGDDQLDAGTRGPRRTLERGPPGPRRPVSGLLVPPLCHVRHQGYEAEEARDLTQAYFAYERVKGRWEERFERKYGFWRGLADEVVARYLDCGVWDNGFARARCPKCPQEFLVAFSCKGRGMCPSCGAKRAAELGAFLIDEVVEDVGHAQWVFTIPKMLRVYFLHHRELARLSSSASPPLKPATVIAILSSCSWNSGTPRVRLRMGSSSGWAYVTGSSPFRRRR
jgi:hypothetical protein